MWEQLVEWGLAYVPGAFQWILQILGSLVVLGYAVVKASPSQADDAFLLQLEGVPVLGAVLKVLVKFSPVSRK